MTGGSALLETASSDTQALATIALAEVAETFSAVQSVAAASRELSASTGEISRQVNESERPLSNESLASTAQTLARLGLKAAA